MRNYKLNKKKLLFIKNIKIFFILTFNFIIIIFKLKYKKKIGVISLAHSHNIGNILLKYAIFIKLSQLDYDPYIVGIRKRKHNISLLQQYTKVKIINESFSEIKENEFDILMVNSDQTWRNWDNYFYDIAFLNFSKNWNIPKLVYGASLGLDYWEFTKEDENIAKYLLKNFTAISVREIGSVELIKNHLGIKPIFVLDPTLLIDKKYYLDLIKDFKNDDLVEKPFIFVYSVSSSNRLKKKLVNINPKYNIYYININVKDQIKKFIYGVYNCKGVITDSFHGTVFSIIFNKPFISFIDKNRGKERFNTLNSLFNFNNRIIEFNSSVNIELLETPLKINNYLLRYYKKQSINFLKKNLKKY